MFNDNRVRDRLLTFYNENEDNIELDEFNALLRDLGFDEHSPIQEIELTIRVRVNVSELEAFSKDTLDVANVGVEVERCDTFSHGSATSYTFDVVDMEVTS